MKKSLLGILLPFMIYGVDDIDLDQLDLPQLDSNENATLQIPNEENVEKLDIPLSKIQDLKTEEMPSPQETKPQETKPQETKQEHQDDVTQQKQEMEQKQEIPSLQEQPQEDIKPQEDVKMQEDLHLLPQDTNMQEELVEEKHKDVQEQEKQANKEEQTQPAKKPSTQLEENTKQSISKPEGKEVIFTQEDFFELDEDDFALEKQDGYFVLRVLSLDLEAFLNGKTYNEKDQVQTFGVNDNFTQIVSQDGKIQEYRFFQKANKKNTILNRMKMPLEKIDFDSYKIVMEKYPNFFDMSHCKVSIKKELSAVLNQNKEVIIDLDIKRELRNTTNFKLFLDCPR